MMIKVDRSDKLSKEEQSIEATPVLSHVSVETIRAQLNSNFVLHHHELERQTTNRLQHIAPNPSLLSDTYSTIWLTLLHLHVVVSARAVASVAVTEAAAVDAEVPEEEATRTRARNGNP